MSFTSKGTSEILVSGLQDTMLVIEVSKGEVVKQASPIAHAGLSPVLATDPQAGPYRASLHNNEEKSVYLCGDEDRSCRYAGSSFLQSHQDLARPRRLHK